MAEFEIINRGGHTYKRHKGYHDRWTDEKGNVVDLTNGNRTVIASNSKRIGSGNNAANPDVWIANGKAYKDASHGGYKSNYFNAVKKLGQNLGWEVKKGSTSAAALKEQNKAFNASKTKLSKGSVGYISNEGKAVGLKKRQHIKKSSNTPEEDSAFNEFAKGWNAFWNNSKMYDPEATGLSYGRTTIQDPSIPIETGVTTADGTKAYGAALGVALAPSMVTSLGWKGAGITLARGAAGSYFGGVAGTYGSRALGATADEQQFFGDIGSLVGGSVGGYPRTKGVGSVTATLDEGAPSEVVGYLPAPKTTIPKVSSEPVIGLPAPKSTPNPNIKGLPYKVEAVVGNVGSANKALPAPKTSTTQPALEGATKVSGSTTTFPEGFRLDTSTRFPNLGRSSAFNYIKGVQNAFKRQV